MKRIDKPFVRFNEQEQKTIMDFITIIYDLDECIPDVDFGSALINFWTKFDEYVESW